MGHSLYIKKARLLMPTPTATLSPKRRAQQRAVQTRARMTRPQRIFGAELRRLRCQVHPSIGEAADCAGVSRAAWYCWESGSGLPTLRLLQGVIKTLYLTESEVSKLIRLVATESITKPTPHKGAP